MNTIKIENMSKLYKSKSILKNINLEFKENAISFLMGPNGAGKTTFIKCIMNLENYNGKVTFNDKSLAEVKDKCLVLWDDCPFYSDLSGINNLNLFSEGRKSKNEIFQIALKYLSEDLLKHKVKTYSYGEKKKLALALVDILEPEYLIMDEISNGLDYDTMRNLKKQIVEWAKSKTIILTGHQFDFYEQIVQYVYTFQQDSIILQDKNDISLEDIYDKKIYKA